MDNFDDIYKELNDLEYFWAAYHLKLSYKRHINPQKHVELLDKSYVFYQRFNHYMKYLHGDAWRSDVSIYDTYKSHLSFLLPNLIKDFNK